VCVVVGPYSIPIQPFASTREHAVVGVGGTPRPMNDLVLPCDRKVDIRGVDAVGNGTALVIFEVRVMVDGVRAVGAESGGNTKNVWEGVSKAGGIFLVMVVGREFFWDLRRWRGGDDGLRDSVRGRGGISCAEAGATADMGDDGTGGRSPSGGGRRLTFVPRDDGGDAGLKEDFAAELGVAGIWNDVRDIGAEGGGRGVASGRAVSGVNGVARSVPGRPSQGDSLNVEHDSSSPLELLCRELALSKPPPTPSSSSSSSSSTRFSLNTLPVEVILLAADPARLRSL
jgi:hypothetical protein